MLFIQQAIDPEEMAVVTVAASKEIIFEGGPQPWTVDTSGYYEKGSLWFNTGVGNLFEQRDIL